MRTFISIHPFREIDVVCDLEQDDSTPESALVTGSFWVQGMKVHAFYDIFLCFYFSPSLDLYLLYYPV